MTYAEKLAAAGVEIDSEIRRLENTYASRIAELERRLSARENGCVSVLSPLDSEVIDDCIVRCKEQGGNFDDIVKEQPRLQVEYDFYRLLDTESLTELLSSLVESDIRYIFEDAAKAGNVGVMDVCLRVWNDRLINSTCGPRNPLMLACRKGSTQCVNFLLSVGAKPTVFADGSTPLHMAAARGDKNMIEALITKIIPSDLLASLEAEDEQGRMPEDACTLEECRLLMRSNRVVGLSFTGNELYRMQNFTEAADRYSTALTLCDTLGSNFQKDNRVKLRYNLGRAKYRQGKWLEAIEECAYCLKEDSSYVSAYAQRAHCYVALLQFSEASKDFSLAAELSSVQGKYRCGADLKSKAALADRLVAADAYAILGLKRATATEAEIKSSFRDLAKKWHPDKIHGSADLKVRAKNYFTRVQSAYQTLSDSGERRDYDLSLRFAKLQSPTSGNLTEKEAAEIFRVDPPASPTKVFASLAGSVENENPISRKFPKFSPILSSSSSEGSSPRLGPNRFFDSDDSN